MDTQIHLYSVDTKAFYTKEENNYSMIKTYASIRINNIKSQLKEQANEIIKTNKDKILEICRYDIETELILKGYDDEEIDLIINEKSIHKKVNELNNDIYKMLLQKHIHIEKYKEIYINAKKKFNTLIKEYQGVRQLNHQHLNDKNKISLFESSLTRMMDLKPNEITNDLLIIRPYHYIILKQLIRNGYDFNNNHYRVLTASAGQIRTKKCVFINEQLWKDKEKTIMCGLTIENMNKSKENGMNLTKFMAYIALNNSATDEWKDFDIDKAIVVKDFETNVKGLVDYIDVKKLEYAKTIEECIERKKMNVPIPHSDGAGMILPKLCKKNFMVRLPWVKGLLTPVDFIRFCKTERKIKNEKDRYKVIDFWGKEYDLIKDDIQIIFTESQFKAIKYYKDWEQYKTWFKRYNCKANFCNMETDTKEFRQASLNYQMLQTITDITDEEIKYFTSPIEDYISKGYTDLKTQLDILGVNRYYKTNLQKALKLYPEMIQESYVKSLLSDNLNKKKKQAKFAKFKVDAKYTFAIPDVYAWCEFLFNNDPNPKGILKHNGTVSCKLFKNKPHLTVNRSPHLYRELGTRINVINKETKKWFITDGCYTSSHDLITKLLQNDNDGDKYLVIADEMYFNIARRNMRGIVPLYYEMAKAKPQLINADSLYNALTEGYKYGNVGQYSNKITVMFNQSKIDLNAIKILTCLNNFYIDGAKTSYMPEVSENIKERIKKANGKLPYFFKFAKDKTDKQVKTINSSTVNRICKNIEDIKQGDFDFRHHGSFRYAILLNNKDIEINKELIKYYLKLDREKNKIFRNSQLTKHELYDSINNTIKSNIIKKSQELNIDYKDMVDMIVKHIYTKHKNLKKTLLWDIFGGDIINNINNNLSLSLEDKKVSMCEECGKRFKKKSNKQVYCDKCSKEIERIKNKERKQKQRRKNVTV